MKKALIHDWFSTYAGAEKCIESFTNIWNDFEIYGLIDFLSDSNRTYQLCSKATVCKKKVPKLFAIISVCDRAV